jgi:hypothetical protein
MHLPTHLEICNSNFWFSTARVVTRTRVIVTLWVHCMSCSDHMLVPEACSAHSSVQYTRCLSYTWIEQKNLCADRISSAVKVTKSSKLDAFRMNSQKKALKQWGIFFFQQYNFVHWQLFAPESYSCIIMGCSSVRGLNSDQQKLVTPALQWNSALFICSVTGYNLCGR